MCQQRCGRRPSRQGSWKNWWEIDEIRARVTEWVKWQARKGRWGWLVGWRNTGEWSGTPTRLVSCRALRVGYSSVSLLSDGRMVSCLLLPRNEDPFQIPFLSHTSRACLNSKFLFPPNLLEFYSLYYINSISLCPLLEVSCGAFHLSFKMFIHI